MQLVSLGPWFGVLTRSSAVWWVLRILVRDSICWRYSHLPDFHRLRSGILTAAAGRFDRSRRAAGPCQQQDLCGEGKKKTQFVLYGPSLSSIRPNSGFITLGFCPLNRPAPAARSARAAGW
jgi:hypothetical protein